MNLISRHYTVIAAMTYFLQFVSLEITEITEILYFSRNLGNCFQVLCVSVGLYMSKKLFIN